MSAQNKATVEAINEAFRQNNIHGFLDHCTEGITWNMIGQTNPLVGKDAITAFMNGGGSTEGPELELYNVIADGDKAAADGKMKMKKQDGSVYEGAFCDVYHFEGDKVARLDSYIIDL